MSATIRWPSGGTQVFEQLPVNHRIEIEEGAGSFSAKAFSPAAAVGDAPAPVADALPENVATWLIEPLKAPEFSLPGFDGKHTGPRFNCATALL